MQIYRKLGCLQRLFLFIISIPINVYFRSLKNTNCYFCIIKKKKKNTSISILFTLYSKIISKFVSLILILKTKNILIKCLT